MSGVLVKKITEEISKHLDGYRDLVEKRHRVEERLRRAREEKRSVKEAIFQRVTAEYAAEIEKLEQDIAPLRNKVERIRQEINDGCQDAEGRIRKAREEIEELSFRQRVGEFDESELADRERPLRDKITELTAHLEDFKALLVTIQDPATEDDGGEIGSMADPESEPAAEQMSKPSPPPAAAKEPEPAQQQKPVSAPRDEAPPAPRTRPAQDDTKSATDTDVIDTSGWADELRKDMDRSVRIRGRRATDPPVDEPSEAIAPTETREGKKVAAPSTASSSGMAGDSTNGAFPNLVITKGPGSGKKLPLIPVTMTLGREHDNNIELKDEEVSRYHARIVYSSGQYRIEDLESSSGTWVNGEKITESVIKHGDKIRVGETELLIDFE